MLDHLGAMLSQLGVMLGDLGAMLGLCWAIMRPSWAYLGPSWGHLGPILGHLGAILALCWAILGHLGPSWGHLGPMLGHLGPSWGHLGPMLGHILGLCWGRGVPPENLMSDLCCFFGRAKNTVNYSVFLNYGTPRMVGICSLGWGHGSRASSQKLALLEGNTRQRGTLRAHAILKVGMPFRSGSPGIYCSCL